jgi:hypothetical protein
MVNRLFKSSIEDGRVALRTNDFVLSFLLAQRLSLRWLVHNPLPASDHRPPPLGQMKSMHGIQKQETSHSRVQIVAASPVLIERSELTQQFGRGEGRDSRGQGHVVEGEVVVVFGGQDDLEEQGMARDGVVRGGRGSHG